MEKEINTTVAKAVRLYDFLHCHSYTLGYVVVNQWI